MSNGNPAPPPPPPPPPSRDEGSPNFGGESSSLGSRLREAMSVPLGGGKLEPAKVGKGYGVRWSKSFNKGGKVSPASKRADGIAQRGKTKGRYL
jgi:hypothetical protein